MSRGGAILASLLVTLGRPAWWLLALAGFLIRGGFVVFVLPIVLLPSPLAMSNFLGPLIVPVAFGRIGPEVVALVVVAVGLLLGWLVAGGWVAATTDLVLIKEGANAAVEEGFGGAGDGAQGVAGAFGARTDSSRMTARRDRILIGRMLAARLIAWLPLAAAIGIGVVRIVGITYVQLTRPLDVATPLAVRVARDAAPELALIAVAWVLGEVVGGLAARRIVLDSATPARALRGAASDIVRRPVSTLLTWLAATGLLVLILAATVGAANLAWSRVIVALSGRSDEPLAAALNPLLFVAIWLAALLATGVFAAVRGSIQTFEHVRHASATGTFGASAHRRPGDWSVTDEGGSL